MKGSSHITALVLLVLLALSSFGGVSLASSGDRQGKFKRCVQDCSAIDCADTAPRLPLHLRALFWTCSSNCDYKCQRKLTEQAKAAGGRIHQYHGKWPFKRLWGIQEPASVVFSVLNGYMHLKNWRAVRSEVPRRHPMRLWLQLFMVFGSWTWLWSSVFHIRDFPITEKFDYYSAGLNVMYILFLGVVRALRLDSWRQTRRLAVCFAIPYLMHVGYLSFIKFDYKYNMTANAIVGLLANFAWFYVTYQAYRDSQPMWWKPVILTVLTDLAFSLEAFDFPPIWDVFDAHALWHAATIPIVAHWYDFLIKNAKWDRSVTQLRKD